MRKPSKIRRARRERKQRKITVDFETRSADVLLSGHYHIGDVHAGMSIGNLHHQLLAYGHFAKCDPRWGVMHGGDYIHHDQHFTGEHPDARHVFEGTLYATDYKLAKEVLDDAARSMLRTVEPKDKNDGE